MQGKDNCKVYKGTITDVGHWIHYAYDDNELGFDKYWRHRMFHYAGEKGCYSNKERYRGPRLDISITVEKNDLIATNIEVNIYSEVMQTLGYKRMSPKLYTSFERNIGKEIDIYVKDDSTIYLDIRNLFSLNYGYRI